MRGFPLAKALRRWRVFAGERRRLRRAGEEVAVGSAVTPGGRGKPSPIGSTAAGAAAASVALLALASPVGTLAVAAGGGTAAPMVLSSAACALYTAISEVAALRVGVDRRQALRPGQA